MREIKYYRVCRVKCKRCGDVLEHVNRTKEPQSHRMLTCTCGKVQLDPHVCAYRINGYPEDYEDLSEEWESEIMTKRNLNLGTDYIESSDEPMQFPEDTMTPAELDKRMAELEKEFGF